MAGVSDSSGYAIVQRGPNSRLWQRTRVQTNAIGTLTTNLQSYTELASGICYIANGQYVDSVEEVNPVPGGAQAIQGRHQVRWFLNANTSGGAVTVTTPDAKQLSSTVFGLAYYDAASGSSAVIARLKDSTGSIIAPNQVLYAGAFSNLTADLLYTYRKAGLSQDIVLRQSPPPPDSYQLSDESTVLQIWTEFFNPPQPEVSAVTNNNAVDARLLDFGEMKMGLGQAFFLNGQDAVVSAGMVAKQWIEVNHRTFLIESIPYAAVASMLQQLPHASNLKPARGPIRRMAFVEPSPPRPGGSAKAGSPMKLARAQTAQPRLKLDYELLSTATNVTFQSDTTYYVSGVVGIFGTNTFEGGAVIKYAPNASMDVVGNFVPSQLNFLTAPYRPVIFTAKDDDSIGDVISGSTGNPRTNYYANPALVLTYAPPTMANVRFSYASQAVEICYSGTTTLIKDAQFVNCSAGINASAGNGPVFIENALFANVQTPLAGLLPNAAVTGENITFSGSSFLATIQYLPPAPLPSLNFTNCIFSQVTNLVGYPPSSPAVLSYSVNGNFNGFYNGPSFGGVITNTIYPFQTVGHGAYYLANNTAFTNAGTTNIDPALLTNLQNTTTYPPAMLLNQTFASNTNLSPCVSRDSNWVSSGGGPDLGYHYDAIDCEMCSLTVTGGATTIAPGTAIATLAGGDHAYGLRLGSCGFYAQGTPLQPIWIVSCDLVQENSLAASPSGPNILATDDSAQPASLRFVNWSMPSGSISLYSWQQALAFQDCQLYGGQIVSQCPRVSFTNCLFHRVDVDFNDILDNFAETNAFYNDLFLGGGVALSYYTTSGYPVPVFTWTFSDNLFDQTAIPQNGVTINVCLSNAYIAGCPTLTSASNSPPVILAASPAYETGALGPYYYPTNLPLIHDGSRSALAAGLYYDTVTTNNVMEGTNTVSIGFHYAALGANGLPLGPPSSAGTDFWVTFPYEITFDGGGAFTTYGQLILYVSSQETNTGTVAIAGEFTNDFTLMPGELTKIVLPHSALLDNSTYDENITNGIHVTASQPVSVYAFIYDQEASAAFACYPTAMMGTSYCVLARPSDVNLSIGSQFAILGTETNTTVTITPSINADLMNGHTNTYTNILDAGVLYQIASTNAFGDVTGTLITSDKPVVVFAGDYDAFVPDTNTLSGNPLVQEQLPVSVWGNQALALSFGRPGGDSFRVLAASNNTEVWINGVEITNLQAGQFYDTILDGAVEFQASNPIQVAQFSQGGNTDFTNNIYYGDPCEILLPPAGYYLNSYTISSSGANEYFTGNFLNLIVPQAAISATLVDGSAVAATNFTNIGSSGYYAARVSVGVGTHTVSSLQPVEVEVYGFQTWDAYGYIGGITCPP